MERLIKQVTDSLIKAGLVEVEVSARHVHLTAEDVEVSCKTKMKEYNMLLSPL